MATHLKGVAVMNAMRKCDGKNRFGDPCGNAAMENGRCFQHGGKSPNRDAFRNQLKAHNMAIEPFNGNGEKALCGCDSCAAEISVPCKHASKRDGQPAKLESPGNAIQKIRKAGWDYIKGKVVCPACIEKRKVVNMQEAKEARTDLRTPTRAQKREIVAMLETAYDDEAQRYMAGETDETVADVLNLMPGWVAEIREEMFGPSGSNEDIDTLRAEADAWQKKTAKDMALGEELFEAVRLHVDSLRKGQARVSEFQAKLERIIKAVGPRKAG